jgi:hypothetical protein
MRKGLGGTCFVVVTLLLLCLLFDVETFIGLIYNHLLPSAKYFADLLQNYCIVDN